MINVLKEENIPSHCLIFDVSAALCACEMLSHGLVRIRFRFGAHFPAPEPNGNPSEWNGVQAATILKISSFSSFARTIYFYFTFACVCVCGYLDHLIVVLFGALSFIVVVSIFHNLIYQMCMGFSVESL